MRIRILFIDILLSLISVYSLSGQKLLVPQSNGFQGKFIHYPITEPGADISTTSLLIDHTGFLWEGTQTALYRYDGCRYVTYGCNSSAETGLSGHIITSLCEDSSGILWVGTFGALNRIDLNTGRVKHFVPDTTNILGNNNKIRLVSIDHSGRLWVLTCGDVYTFNRKTMIFTRYKLNANFIPWSKKTGQFLEDSEGRIWITTPDGLLRFKIEGDSFIVFRNIKSDPVSISCSNITCVAEDYSGTIWCGTRGGGLNMISDPEKGIFKRINPGSLKNHEHFPDTINSILPDKKGPLWITSNGVFGSYSPADSIVNIFRVKPVNRFFDNTRGKTMSFEEAFQTDESSIWFYQIQGILFRFDIRSEKLTMYGLPNWVIFHAIADNDRSIWFGCANGNTWRLMTGSLPFQSMYVKNMFNVALNNNPRIVEDDSKKVWLALSTGNYSTSKIETGTFIKQKTGHFRAGDTIATCMIKDRKGKIWASSPDGYISAFDPVSMTSRIYKVPENTGSGVYNIAEDHFGNIWLLTYFKIFVLPAGSDKIEEFKIIDNDLREAINEGLYDICCDSRGLIWIAAFSNGIYCYNQSDKKLMKFRSYRESELLGGDYCIRIKEDSKGRIWALFYSNGLYLMDRESGKIKPVRIMKNPPAGISFLDLIADRNNRLLIFHSYGITAYNPDSNRLQQVTFSQQPGNYYSYQLTNGSILNLSGNDLKLIPDSVPCNKRIPKICLTGLTINEKDYYNVMHKPVDLTLLENLRLRHNQNNLRFEFAALNFLYPENNKYQYFMSGADRDTVYSSGYHPVEYKNLRPGKYIFWFTGSNNDGIWNTQGKSIAIRISPPLSESRLTFFLYGILFIVICSVLILRYNNKLIRDRKRLENEVRLRTSELEKKNLQIEQLDRMKTNLFTEISHELRTPLSLIMGPVDNLIENYENIDSGRRLNLMGLIKRNSSRLFNLINQLLDISRIDAGKMKINLSEYDLLKSLRILIYEFLSVAESKKIIYNIEIPDGTFTTFFDRDKLEKIVSNLLTNAFKFTPAFGTITCKVEILDSAEVGNHPILILTVRDTGTGISKENLDKIFDRFYCVEGEGESDGMGSGIGLSLAREFINLLHGNIEVTSEKGVGSTFTVRMPVGKDYLSVNEYVTAAYHQNVNGVTIGIEKIHQIVTRNKERVSVHLKPQLLIVEDNNDLREFLKETLLNDYQVFDAADGKSGLDIARSKIPDLVIADVIIPIIDGMELCRELKTDERTSHIPLIMLTAKTSQENRIEGFSVGADDYLTKPFVINELKVRISNLLVQRARLRRKYALMAESESYSGSGGNPVDDLFINKVNSIILENITKLDFNVSALQEKIGMSKISFYRKYKALTGSTPNSLILKHRMKKAAKMLRERELNVTQVSISVGYSNPSYFSKTFKEYFGVSPKDFITQPDKQERVI